MKRKYGNNIEEILKYKEEVKQEIYEIENLEEYTNKLKKDLEVLEAEMKELCKKMNAIRIEYSKVLEEQIQKANEAKDFYIFSNNIFLSM